MPPSRCAARLAGLSIVLSLALAAAVPAGCRSAGRTATPDVPEDFRMVFGEGGGFAGRWEGFTIHADGRVEAWAGPMAEAQPQPAGKLSAAALDTLWTRLAAVDFFEVDLEDVGNMTTFIKVSADGRTHRVSWVPRISGLEPALAIEALYERAVMLAREAPGS